MTIFIVAFVFVLVTALIAGIMGIPGAAFNPYSDDDDNDYNNDTDY